ncbi:glutathione-disulfide reductase [Salinibius halmophilus]|uniref:glutathione-disulfide reductase n=1 Tax=Salinibius halmophilus TaxID=1853216 RepID=UPI000E668FF5|nr:glutathione-disulfide reductase [Salinibius halmophilus]
MSKFDYDLFVIGAGSGGVRAARTAANLGAKVGVAEGRFYGGTCVNVGCVPKKLYVYASDFAHRFAEARGFGHQLHERSFDWGTLKAAKDKEISRLNGIYERLLENSGVDRHWGYAKFVDAHTLDVEGKQVTAKNIIIATGGTPMMPTIPGGEHIKQSDDMFTLESLPKSVLVIGGGYIALEFAGIFNGLGVETHLVHRGDHVLRGFDEDVRPFVQDQVANRGINLHMSRTVESVEKQADNRLLVRLNSGETLTVDDIFSATGRLPNTGNLELEKLGIKTTSRGAIEVNEHYQVAEHSHIFAVGDVIDRIALTPVALAEGMFVANMLFGSSARRVNYNAVASAVFSQPEVATCGATESQARHQHVHVDVYESKFRPMSHTLSGNPEQCYMKLVVDRATQQVLGAHMVGEHAAEIMQGIAIAIQMGATKQQFDATIGIHPSAAEEFVTMRTPRD